MGISKGIGPAALKEHTVLEIELNVVTPYIGCHGYYRCSIKLPDEMARSNAIEVRHDDVHKN